MTAPDENGVARADIGLWAPAWADLLAVLGNPVRFRLIEVMLQGELNVGALAETVSLSQSATSQHLSRLKIAGLVAARGDAQLRFYAIVDQKRELLSRLMAIAEDHVTSKNPPMRRRKWGSSRRP